MKRIANGFGSGGAAGAGWFKVWHDGYNNGEFCIERLRRNGGMMQVVIPRDLAEYVGGLPASMFCSAA
jgi:hypothetical protein